MESQRPAGRGCDLSLARGPNGPLRSLESANSRRPLAAGPNPGGSALRAAPPGLGAETGEGSPTACGSQAFERT
eukprot:5939139-Alexandrium_andersonii.AAC.1